MSPKQVKRAIEPIQKRGGPRIVTVIGKPGQTPKAIPEAGTVSGKPKPKSPADMFAAALGTALGVKAASPPPSTVKFTRATAPLPAMGIRTKAPAFVVGYVRASAPTDAGYLQAFANAGAHEVRREGPKSNNVLRGLIKYLAPGDVILVDNLSSLCRQQDLEKHVALLDERGVNLATLDGEFDTRTAKGRGKIDGLILSARKFTGALRL